MRLAGDGLDGMRKGFDGLAALVQDHFRRYPFSGQAFVFRGRQDRLTEVCPPLCPDQPGWHRRRG